MLHEAGTGPQDETTRLETVGRQGGVDEDWDERDALDGIDLGGLPPAPVLGGAAGGAGSLRMPLAPVTDTRFRPLVALATIAAAVLVGLTQAGPGGQGGPFVGVTLLLVALVALGWPGLVGSYTPGVAAGLLCAVGVTGVAAAAVSSQPWPWVLAVIAFGLIATFLRQLTRPVPREGLVLSIVAAVSGIAVIAAGLLGLSVGTDPISRGTYLVAVVAAAASLAGDLCIVVRPLRVFASVVAAVVGMVAGVVTAKVVGEPSIALGLGLAGVAASLSFTARRVVSQAPAILGWPGQVAAGVASVLLVGPVAWAALQLV